MERWGLVSSRRSYASRRAWLLLLGLQSRAGAALWESWASWERESKSWGWQRRGRGTESRAYQVHGRLQHPGLLRVRVRRWPTNCFSRCAIRAVSCVLLLRRARGPRVACRAGSARARTARLCCPGGRSMECAPSQLRSFRTRTSFRNVHPWLCGARLGRAWSTDVAGVEFPAPPSRGHFTGEPKWPFSHTK